jgi:hypothetical protein
MISYDCSPDSVRNEAVGVCNSCSAGICRKHAVEVEKAHNRLAPDRSGGELARLPVSDTDWYPIGGF